MAPNASPMKPSIRNRRDAIRRLAATHTASAIARAVGYHKTVVHTDLRAMGICAQRRTRSGSQRVRERWAQVALLLKKGEPVACIAQALDVPRHTVRNDLFQMRLRGILPPSNSSHRSPLRWKVRLHDLQTGISLGHSLRRMGRDLGVSAETVRIWLLQSGLRPVRTR